MEVITENMVESLAKTWTRDEIRYMQGREEGIEEGIEQGISEIAALTDIDEVTIRRIAEQL